MRSWVEKCSSIAAPVRCGTVPATVVLDDNILEAKAASRKLFKALPDSPERKDILDALRRLGKSNLKRKIFHRAIPVIDKMGDQFPYLLQVLEQAVDCRNYFVHGADKGIDYEKDFFSTVPFLTDSLEFVFAASDLMEAGWDCVGWSQKGSTMSHPFDAYRVNYDGQLAAFNAVLPENQKIG